MSGSGGSYDECMCLGSDFLGLLDNSPITNANFLHLGRGLSLPRVSRGAIRRVAAFFYPFSEAVESKPSRGKKKYTESSSVKKLKFDMLRINELTWPELACRYILVILSLEGNLDSAEITSSIGGKIFHSLQGDGGLLCGSLAGVAGMEADALILAEARKQIFGSPKNNAIFSVDHSKPEAISTPRLFEVNGDEIPEWAQVLEPVRKLPTNVGARIKKCVNQALELNPPEWAKKILVYSISREVYKGNTSGPMKRAVVSLLSEFSSKGVQLQPKPVKRESSEGVRTFSDLVMKQCRIVLRLAAAEDDKKVLCNLLGKTLNPDDEGLLGSPASVSRPLDFRAMDFRLAAGAYAGSHEAFLEDVFEVLLLIGKLEQLVKVMESSLPKAPWEDGICRVCGVDRDDDHVLLCDGCDLEYYAYCLNPPLASIPDGNWYCPSCVAGRYKFQGPRGAQVARFKQKRIRGEFTQVAEDKNGDSSTLPIIDSDLTSIRDELSTVEEAISSIESELEKMSIRKDFLGRDSAGRVYWGFGRPDTCSLLVDGSLEIPSEDYMNMGYTHAGRAPTSGWISFQSDGEISEIVEWLSGGEARDVELRESILQWQTSKAKEENISRNGKRPESSKIPVSSDCRFTKAATVLEKRYGPSLCLNLGDRSKGQTQNGKFPLEGAMYRCECLELIWPSKHHCFLSHKTHPGREELENHYDRNCINRAEEEARKGKKIAPEPQTKKRPDEKRVGKGSKEKNKISFAKSKTQDSDCPHDFKEISSKFVTQNSLRELVRGIGLIGSSGIPSFIPGPLSYFDDTALRLAPINEEFKSGNESKDSGDMPHQSREGTSNSNNFPWRFGNDRGESTSKVNIPYHNDYRSDFPIRRHRGSAGGDSRCVIPESSLRRLVSRESAILRQLKMNLLDMEAALPDEAVRPSMAQPERRSAWSSFVKSAGSIYEMVQATIVLENMIRADYLRREWWYWSSLTAAANISTLSALALRLFTLEAAIMYERPPPAADSTEVSGLDNQENEPTPPKSDKGKEKASPSKKSDSPKRKGKANKRRKDSGK